MADMFWKCGSPHLHLPRLPHFHTETKLQGPTGHNYFSTTTKTSHNYFNHVQRVIHLFCSTLHQLWHENRYFEVGEYKVVMFYKNAITFS